MKINISKNILKITETVVKESKPEEVQAWKEKVKATLQQYLVEVDSKVENELIKAIDEKQTAKCKKRQAIFNFTDKELTEEQNEILSNGKNFVVRVSEEQASGERRVRSELKLYVQKYCSKYKINLPEAMWLGPLEPILQSISENAGVSEIHREFMARLSGKLVKACNQVKMNCRTSSVQVKSAEEIEKMLNFENYILIGKTFNFKILKF